MITLIITKKELNLVRNALGITYSSKTNILDENHTKLSHKSMLSIQRDADKYRTLNKKLKQLKSA